jgi:hypothetical protein
LNEINILMNLCDLCITCSRSKSPAREAALSSHQMARLTRPTIRGSLPMTYWTTREQVDYTVEQFN